MNSHNSMSKDMHNNWLILHKRSLRLLLPLLTVVVAALPVAAQTTQTQYTLTDGDFLWYNNTHSAGEHQTYPIMYSFHAVESNGDTTWWTIGGLTSFEQELPQGLHSSGFQLKDSSYFLGVGANYLTLQVPSSIDDSDEQGGARLVNSTEFSPYASWSRTDREGYYYQEWTVGGEDYRFYLYRSGTQLLVIPHKNGEPLQKATFWSDWDFGVSMQEDFLRGGEMSHNYYWIVRSEADGWTMSCNTYDRPDGIKLYNIGELGKERWANFCDNVKAAQFMTVTRQQYDRTVEEGYSAIESLTLKQGGSEVTEIDFEKGATVSSTCSVKDGMKALVMPAYVQYIEETKREGVNCQWYNRYGDTIGGAGKPTVSTSYFLFDETTGDFTKQTASKPEATNEELVLEKMEYSVNNGAKRFVTIDAATGEITCQNMPSANEIITVTATVTYKNGITESIQKELLLKVNTTPKPVVAREKGPVVGVAVFGGGRLANVGTNTNVTIHYCDTIPYVYGGNDIGGEVSGTSTVRLGHSTHTTKTTPVHIGSVYGGGNGYYNYADITEGVEMTATKFGGKVSQWGSETDFVRDLDFAQTPIEIAEGSEVAIPDIAATHVMVRQQYVTVDSLFGGARNAYVNNGGTKATAVTIDQQDGTVLAEFGGNNVGGSLKNDIVINISGSRTVGDDGIDQSTVSTGFENTYLDGFGRDFGVRYLFGGGNKVKASNVKITMTGGMIDTLFAGGNSATVDATEVTIDCSDVIFKNSSADDFAAFDKKYASSWVGGKGNYNVRCLFGGNNQADMECLPVLTLLQGGIGTVYGGGNAGDMLAGVTDDSYLSTHWNSTFAKDVHVAKPSAIGTKVIVDPAAGKDLKIDYLYGGCQMANVKNSTFVHVAGGSIGSIFGGCNISGDVGSSPDGTYCEGTYVWIAGGDIYEDVYGGSNGGYHCNDGSVYTDGMQFKDNQGDAFDPYDLYVDHTTIPTHNMTNLVFTSGKVGGNMYGGANLANVGSSEGTFTTTSGGSEVAKPSYGQEQITKNGSVHLTMTSGEVFGNVFGGGNMAYIYAISNLRVGGDAKIRGSFYAGNDKVGFTNTYGKYIDNSGASDVTDADFIASDNSSLNSKVDGKYQNIFASYVYLYGKPEIRNVYGGGNGAYNYDGTRPEYPTIEYCAASADNRPKQESAFVDINVDNGQLDTVFGGGNGVGVNRAIVVALNATNASGEYVSTIFGGNNRDDVNNSVPEVRLLVGQVNDVYGGCNAGDMTAKSSQLKDACNNSVLDVSSFVQVNSDKAQVNGTIYGGCNQADVTGTAYVQILNTSEGGIKRVFGGNNISGNIGGNTRVDMSGGKVGSIYGGSNGYYDYMLMGDATYKVYAFGSLGNEDSVVATGTTGQPNVARTQVNLWGGHITENAYGGGRMGDCDSTYMVVDDRETSCTDGTLTIDGTIYGGGEGNWDCLNQKHRGNVNYATHVELYHAASVNGDEAKAYGGGRGGDVQDTYIRLHESWEQPFLEIYGGCWGSNVFGSTHLTLNGQQSGSAMSAHYVYGGNDYTGNVYRSQVQINSGRYGTVYGAGNGYYNYGAGVVGCNEGLTVPNTEYVDVDVKYAIVDSNLYGGGRLGTTFAYRKDKNGRYIDSENNYVDDPLKAQPSKALTFTDPNDYSNIVVTVHDGLFHGDIFAGGEGKDQQLVYGLKVLNMEGGSVDHSIYGGSQSVDDGYPAECYNDASAQTITTTLRPSSVINLTGGYINSYVYGAGFKGNTHGSAYVNVGVKAVDSCVAWVHTVNGTEKAYSSFMPGNGTYPALSASQLTINGSIYGGANWGDNEGSFDFRVPGFMGGENYIRIDGEGYNTSSLPEDNIKPLLHIENSIIGSGTSVQGGDVLSRVELLNYGALDESCRPSKMLRSIQRVHTLYLHNTAVEYTGASDAVNARTSAQYTLIRVDTIVQRGFNIVQIDAQATEIHDIYFVEDHLYNDVSTKDTAWAEMASLEANASLCSDEAWCDKLKLVRDTKHCAIIISGGVNLDVNCTETKANNFGHHDHADAYGHVKGFGYLLAPEGTNAVVMAGAKYYKSSSDEKNSNDGGFLSTCSDENQHLKGFNNLTAEWEACSAAGTCEYPYSNYTQLYRAWSVGEGYRSRVAVVLAHRDPERLEENKKILIGDAASSDNQMALAYAKLVLPPTQPGHYYKLDPTAGIYIADDNAAMRLVDQGWDPELKGTEWESFNVKNGTEKAWSSKADGSLVKADGEDAMLYGMADIKNNPSSYFGLIMAAGENFNTGTDPAGRVPMVISANPYVNVTGADQKTASVTNQDNVSPVMDLYLTYSPTFSTTLLSTVYFTLIEYDESGNPIGKNGTGMPIHVEVIISTVMEEYDDMEFDLLAMYNEGRTNTYSRKAVLPATLKRRDLYVKDVTWYPAEYEDVAHAGQCKDGMFLLTGDTSLISAADASNNRFSVSITPNDNVSANQTNDLGWEAGYVNRKPADAVALTSDKSTLSSYSGSGTCGSPQTLDVLNKDKGIGYWLGLLDGRGAAALDLTLTFDGDRVYPEKQVVGKVVYTLKAVGDDESTAKEFTITINVTTRDHGDTIYIASADKIYWGDGEDDYWTKKSIKDKEDIEAAGKELGKWPSTYVGTFEEALSRIYEPGDVIAIIDTVNISKNVITIQGEDVPIPIIRYAGHHHELPGEKHVYRGPMIKVGEKGSLNAHNIDFIGSSVNKITFGGVERNASNDVVPIKPEVAEANANSNASALQVPYCDAVRSYYEGSPVMSTYKRLDTNIAFYPVIVINSGSYVTLSDGTTFEDTWNGATANDANHLMGAAIYVDKDAKLTLQNNVTFRNNISHYDNSLGHAMNGTIYLNGGTMALRNSGSTTAITIANNRVIDTDSITDGLFPFWERYERTYDGVNRLIRYDVSDKALEQKRLGNVYLTREEPTGSFTDYEKQMLDKKTNSSNYTDVITLEKEGEGSLVAEATRIGISKWFPGENVRDTIRAVYYRGGVASSMKLTLPSANNNFFSDEGHNVFYSEYVNHQYIYLQRCATFRHQSIDWTGKTFANGGLRNAGETRDVLQYLMDESATCPTGGEKLVYNIQGGFFPYTYSWYSGTEKSSLALARTYSTPYKNNAVDEQIASGDYAAYLAGLSDTMATVALDMRYSSTNSMVAYYTVSATDLAGCELYKDIEITNVKTDDPTKAAVVGLESLKDTARAHTAELTRNFQAVRITPFIWADRADGVIAVTAMSDKYKDSVFVVDETEGRHDLDNVLFCAGDQIRLYTKPTTGSENKFVMWDFDPYYNNPAYYTVPPASTKVVAYYAPQTYWVHHINSEDKANVYYSGTYYYSDDNVPANTGYAITYHGDVHIYNEDGLAWFISNVNGLNGTQAKTFYYNSVYLHQKEDNTAYDMSEYLWTPVGTPQHPFRGWFIGTESSQKSTTEASSPVVIKNLIINEPNSTYAGFFGNIDTARIHNIALQSSMVRGSQYVGTLAARSRKSQIESVAVQSDLADFDSEAEHTASTILTTRYVSGGMVGSSNGDKINNSEISAKFVGSAIYTGGLVGDGLSDTLTNNSIHVDNGRLSAIHAAGIAGNMDGVVVDEGNSDVYTVNVFSANDTMGSVSGSGNYTEGSSVTIAAFANAGYKFVSWSGGYSGTDNPHTFTATGNIAIQANFASEQEEFYNVTLATEPATYNVGYITVKEVITPEGSQGVPNDNNVYAAGTQLVLVPHANTSDNIPIYFLKWEDGSMDTNRLVTINSDTTFTATFAIPNGSIAPINPLGGNATDHVSGRSLVSNNYVYYEVQGGVDRIGGLVSQAKNTTIENNYVYGHFEGISVEGAVGAVLDQGTEASHNYYADGTVSRAAGQVRQNASIDSTPTFSGQGNNVQLAKPSYGVTNLTRALNAWVNGQSGNYRTWRSDLLGNNGGYPVFGVPDLIPVFDTLTITGCDSISYGGHLYTTSTTDQVHIIDSVQMIDSTSRLTVVVNHSSHIDYADTAELGYDYAGYGFQVSAAETELLRATVQEYGVASLTLTDTLANATGCDSIITLTLTFKQSSAIHEAEEEDPSVLRRAAEVKVYPNPATTRVTIETEGLKHVELYDGEGRRLQDYTAAEPTSVTIDVSSLSTGAYYLRIHTATNVTIQKLIKK